MLEPRLSGFYFFYFSILGAIVPYWSVFLQWQQFSAYEIGCLTAAIMLTRIISPGFWGYLSDKALERTQYIKLGCVLALIGFLPIMFYQTFGKTLTLNRSNFF